MKHLAILAVTDSVEIFVMRGHIEGQNALDVVSWTVTVGLSCDSTLSVPLTLTRVNGADPAHGTIGHSMRFCASDGVIDIGIVFPMAALIRAQGLCGVPIFLAELRARELEDAVSARLQRDLVGAMNDAAQEGADQRFILATALDSLQDLTAWRSSV